MTPRRLLKVTITTPVEAEDAVAVLMQRVFRQPLALYTDEETLLTAVSVFLESGRGWGRARQARLEAGLRGLRAQGVPLGRARITRRWLVSQDWAESWKRHFKVLEIGDRLLVRPTWSRRQPRPGQVVMTLDPGLSFGTGHHPTTAFCLEQLVAHEPASRPRSLLDVGCGSGILAIAAARLAYRPVEAFDNDPAAVKIARANAALNQVADSIRFECRSLTRLPARPARSFDVVVANLLADLIESEAARLTAFVARRGTLVLAGILATEFDQVCRSYTELGWRLVVDDQAREWRSGAFRRES